MDRSRVPDGLDPLQSCSSCNGRESGLLSRLPLAALEELDAIRQTSTHPKGAVLFVEGQPAGGVFVLCSGRAKLTVSSARGHSLIVRVAETGDALGLSAVMSNAAYEVRAETLEPMRVSFLPRSDFLRLLQRHSEVTLRVAEHLSFELRAAYQQVARIALASTARAKLAGLLLDWAGRDAAHESAGIRFELCLTHEEVGALIGSSRETVTRLLSEFRRRGLIQTKGAFITLPDPTELSQAYWAEF